jgi:lysophospholipase L1-like esterase
VSPTSIEIAGSEEGLVDKIGDLTMLDTDDKSSLVGAVNELYGRIQPNVKWLALGDSITEGTYTEMEGGEPVSHKNREYAWDTQAAKILGYGLDNRGIGGMGYLQISPDANRPLNLRTLLDLDSTSTIHIISQNDPTTYIDLSIYKLVTINLGVNDWKSPTTYNKIGTLADDSSVTTSVVGNMRYAIEKIMSVNPNAKIIVFSPINCAWELSSNPSTADNNWAIGYTGYGTYTLEDVSEVLKSVCDYYGVEYIDLLHTSVVNRLNIMSLLLDKVHPTQIAHQQLAREISRFLA